MGYRREELKVALFSKMGAGIIFREQEGRTKDE
jgi:hypothetical protein